MNIFFFSLFISLPLSLEDQNPLYQNLHGWIELSHCQNHATELNHGRTFELHFLKGNTSFFFLFLEIYHLCCKICTNIQNHHSQRERERELECSHNYHPLKIKILTFGKGPHFLFSLSTTWTLEEYHNPQKHKADCSDHKKHTPQTSQFPYLFYFIKTLKF